MTTCNHVTASDLAERAALAMEAQQEEIKAAADKARRCYQEHGHGGARAYTWDAADYCPRCAEYLPAHDGLTIAMSAYMAPGLCDTASAVVTGEADYVPMCSVCGAVLTVYRLTTDGMTATEEAYVRLYCQIQRSRRAGQTPGAVEDLAVQYHAILENQGLDMQHLERSARHADRCQYQREIAEGWPQAEPRS